MADFFPQLHGHTDLMILPVDEFPKPVAGLHVDEGLTDVLSEDWDDWHFGLEGYGRKPGPFLPHDLVVGGAGLGLVSSAGSDPDKLTLQK